MLEITDSMPMMIKNYPPFDAECILFVETGFNGRFVNKRESSRIKLTIIDDTFWFGTIEAAFAIEEYLSMLEMAVEIKTNRVLIQFDKDGHPWTATILHCLDNDGIITFTVSSASPIPGVEPKIG
jgi:hypothetical protein